VPPALAPVEAVTRLLAAISYEPIVHIELGPLNISPHGVGIAVGFLLGARLMLPEAKRKGITEDQVYTVLIRAAIGSLIGARVAYVINHLGDYADDPLGVFKVWEGGISLLGGIFGAILLALPVARRLRIDAWRMLDAAAPGIALGILVGRIGDMVVADHLGKPTDFFLGYDCRPGYETASPCLGDIVHQPHLYDLFFVTILLFVLLRLRKRSHEQPTYDGFQILVFGACYGVARFIEDWFRIDETHGTGLTGSQWTAVATTLVCTAWMLFVKRTPGWGHWGDPAEGEVEPADPPRLAEQPEPHPSEER
jgi:phosphatidylglycerol---prolipoprotein diacylglyceryl transferase